MQVFIRLIKDWCTSPYGEEKVCGFLTYFLTSLPRSLDLMVVLQVPGFQTFIIQNFASNCCLYSVLDKSFEFRDANSVS